MSPPARFHGDPAYTLELPPLTLGLDRPTGSVAEANHLAARSAQLEDARRYAASLAPLFAPDQVVQLLVLGYAPSAAADGQTVVGFFDHDHRTELADAARAFAADAGGAFVNLNWLAPAVLDRRPNRMGVAGHGDAAGNDDVTARRWVLIDADAVRPPGVPATDAEKAAAQAVAAAATDYLRGLGWPDPVVSDSGNGFHLLYRIDLPADDGGLVQRVLAAVADKVDTAAATIDRVVHNPARLLRLPGTRNRKGPNTADRPHRPCQLLSVPPAIEVVSREQLEALAGPPPTAAAAALAPAGEATDRLPGTDFDRRGTWPEAGLFEAGWTWHERTGPDAGSLTRPGKASGVSATVGVCARAADGVPYLFCFSDNAGPIPAHEPLTRFGVYARLKHGGDFSAAARALRRMGYGTTQGHLNGEPPLPDADAVPLVPLSAADLLDRHVENRRPVLHGLLRVGETMNLIAPPKFHKSFLTLGLAVCVATGTPWLGRAVEAGRVLLVDNELHAETLASRLRTVLEHHGIPVAAVADRLDVVPLRGRLHDLKGVDAGLSWVAPGRYRLLVLDAWYRLQPEGSDENANGDVTRLYNLLDRMALRMGVAVVCVHHSTKGGQAGKAVTDIGAGAGAQSRAADCHAVLRPHEEDGHVVFEAAARSWPPPAPVTLRWEFPTFVVADGLDPTRLGGRKSAGKAGREATVEDIRAAVAARQPVPLEALVDAVRRACECSDAQARKAVRLAAGQNVIRNSTLAQNKLAMYVLPGWTPAGSA